MSKYSHPVTSVRLAVVKQRPPSLSAVWAKSILLPISKTRPLVLKNKPPYTVALVQLKEGPMVSAQLTDLGDEPVHIGMSVEMVTRKIRNVGNDRGIIAYGYKFRPVMVK